MRRSTSHDVEQRKKVTECHFASLLEGWGACTVWRRRAARQALPAHLQLLSDGRPTFKHYEQQRYASLGGTGCSARTGAGSNLRRCAQPVDL